MSKYDSALMSTAYTFAKESYATRLKVGAVLSKDGRILATGYNGTISGMNNSYEDVVDTVACRICKGSGKAEVLYPKSLMDLQCIDCEGTGNIQVLKTSDFTLHAEQNLITFCAKHGIPTNNTTIYITHSPCKQCAKLIVQSGISEVVYSQDYKDSDGLNFLTECSVTTRKA
ncbi:MAG: deoxycytidylate deaminase [Sulfuricurvum sp.]